MVLMAGKACAWKASELVAVTDITGRLFHKGIVRGKKEYLYEIRVCSDVAELVGVI